MFKNKTKVTLTLKEDKPSNSSNYEQNALYNKGYFASRTTTMNIKHRILELARLNDGDPKVILNKLLKELDKELEDEA